MTLAHQSPQPSQSVRQDESHLHIDAISSDAAVLDLHVLRDWPHPPIFISQATGYFPTLPSVVGQLVLLGVYLVGGLAAWGWSRRRKALAAAAGAGTPEAPADEPALT